MDEDNEFEVRLSDYRKRCSYVKSYADIVKQLLASPLPYSWKLLDELINGGSVDELHYAELRNTIQKSIRSIRSFTMLMYVYSLKQTQSGFQFYSTHWRSEYEEVAVQLGDITIFSSWISTHFKSKIVQETLWVVVRMFPLLLKAEGLCFGEVQLTSVIEWATYFYTLDPDTDKYIDACELIKVAKQTRLSSLQTQDKAQHLLLRKLIEVVCQAKSPSSNVFLFLYPMPLMDQQITYFCEIYSDFLSDLAEDGLYNLFNALTAGAVCKQILLVIQKISYILANEEQFFKLRFLYQKFILPVLAKKAKACPRVQEITFDICSLYVLGFLKHCDIGMEGIECLVKNVGKIVSQSLQFKWVQLCSTVCNWYPDLKEGTKKLVEGELRKNMDLDQFNLDSWGQPECVWNITLRNGRKHKKYFKVQSRMRGISNRNNECYIISTVHGLQKTLCLQSLLDKYRDSIKGRNKLMDELRILFNEVAGNRKADKIVVSYLKKVSPEQFVKSQHQEDAYEYLIKLFDLLEIQMSSIPGMTQQFKSIFQIQENNSVVCLSCKQEKATTSQAYAHTIPNTAILSQSTEEVLSDFTCPKCKSTGSCVMRTELKLGSKIFIVHINRFSTNSDGTIKKELSTQRILRKFLNYELVGLLCHKGKRAERGHYVYYHQVSVKRWALFNDNCVEQFELDQPYEQFERQWKSEMTPYILFYKLAPSP